jgi:hypothetical protein
MLIKYEDQEYEFDIEELTLAQTTRIFKTYGLTLLELEVGMQTGHVDALRAIYWVMLEQNGERIALDRLKFKPVKFARAINAALKDERDAQSEDDEEEATEESPKDDTDSQA